ncbi:hypothetical protein EVAR_53_1 [Eumeta japonica]|uniref:Uncharacterized protein n=1 Tax=Eumeta variegata TaxID=151549 RepID=A0A4C1S7U0_EUMVA|nr:hypothetical protein EVAR_53_1 [Eumeta japonica]
MAEDDMGVTSSMSIITRSIRRVSYAHEEMRVPQIGTGTSHIHVLVHEFMSIYYALAGWSGNRERRDERTKRKRGKEKEGLDCTTFTQETEQMSDAVYADAPRTARCGSPEAERVKILYVQRTKLCCSELSANDILRRYYAPRPFLLLRRVPILRHCDAFVTNFTVAKYHALYLIVVSSESRWACSSAAAWPRKTYSIFMDIVMEKNSEKKFILIS